MFVCMPVLLSQVHVFICSEVKCTCSFMCKPVLLSSWEGKIEESLRRLCWPRAVLREVEGEREWHWSVEQGSKQWMSKPRVAFPPLLAYYPLCQSVQ